MDISSFSDLPPAYSKFQIRSKPSLACTASLIRSWSKTFFSQKLMAEFSSLRTSPKRKSIHFDRSGCWVKKHREMKWKNHLQIPNYELIDLFLSTRKSKSIRSFPFLSKLLTKLSTWDVRTYVRVCMNYRLVIEPGCQIIPAESTNSHEIADHLNKYFHRTFSSKFRTDFSQ